MALNEHALEGCIVGTALYDGRLDLELALRRWLPATEPDRHRPFPTTRGRVLVA